MKKTNKAFATLLALIMALSLAACGGGGGSGGGSAKEDPNAGKYMGYMVDFLGWTAMDEVYSEGENYVYLESGGKGKICFDGDTVKLTWSLEGDKLSLTIEGEEMSGTLADGVLIFDFMGLGDMCFVKEGTEPPVLEGNSLEENIDEALDDAFADLNLEDDSFDDGSFDDVSFDDVSPDDDGINTASVPAGEWADYSFGNGAYTISYPAGAWEPLDWMDALNEPASYGLIEFYIQEDDGQVDDVINNLNLLIDSAQDYEVTDSTYMGAVAQDILVKDEYGDQTLYILIEYGQDMGDAGVALYINVFNWDYVDQEVVRSILDTLVMT